MADCLKCGANPAPCHVKITCQRKHHLEEVGHGELCAKCYLELKQHVYNWVTVKDLTPPPSRAIIESPCGTDIDDK